MIWRLNIIVFCLLFFGTTNILEKFLPTSRIWDVQLLPTHLAKLFSLTSCATLLKISNIPNWTNLVGFPNQLTLNCNFHHRNWENQMKRYPRFKSWENIFSNRHLFAGVLCRLLVLFVIIAECLLCYEKCFCLMRSIHYFFSIFFFEKKIWWNFFYSWVHCF